MREKIINLDNRIGPNLKKKGLVYSMILKFNLFHSKQKFIEPQRRKERKEKLIIIEVKRKVT